MAQSYNTTTAFLNTNSKWIMGSNVKLDKSNNTIIPGSSNLNSFGATATVCDPITGNLLFYTNGYQIWNSNMNLMPNGTGLNNHTSFSSRTQPVCVVPKPGSPNLYYIFSQTDPFAAATILHPPNARLFYSLLDMSLNNGLGDIVSNQKAIVLDSGMSSSLIAVPGNRNDVWLVGHSLESPTFKCWRITENGIGMPELSIVGPTPSLAHKQQYVQGQLAVSPDRRKIAIGTTSRNGELPANVPTLGTVLCDFDPCSGKVSNPILINQSRQHVYGVCFSPDNTKLYTMVTIANSGYGLYQYNITSSNLQDIINSEVKITNPNNSLNWGYMKLYKDTIYISQQGTPSPTGISTITAPNLSGLACNFQFVAISGIGSIYQGLPNDIVASLGSNDTLYNKMLDTIICGEMSIVNLKAPEGTTALFWENGSTSNQRLINSPGTYILYSIKDCKNRVDTYYVKNTNLEFTLGPDRAFCNQSTALLAPSIPHQPGFEYLWNTNATSEYISINNGGVYWLEITFQNCKVSDTINTDFISTTQDLGTDDIACLPTPVNKTLSANVTASSIILWNTGAQTETIHVTEPGTYSVKVNDQGCIGTDTIKIIREYCDCEFIIPNAFTPNHDGINDVFGPITDPACQIESFQFIIFNRWGQRIYQSYTFNNQKGWDGTFNGTICDVGTYYYQISGQKGTQKIDFKYKGEVHLLR
jgi:gliding motility-associated-like protein